MDGIHDLGGMHGFGPVEVEMDEPVFHQPWEGRTFGLAGVAVTVGGFNTPMFRHAIERMDPAHYLSSSYYEHWLTAVATLFVESGAVSQADLEARAGRFPLSRAPLVTGDDVHELDSAPAPRFSVGDTVRVRTMHFGGHTRCPRYVRGHRGTVVRVDHAVPVPEIEAHRQQRVVEPTYSVRFSAVELWEADRGTSAAVHVDLYERYLDPA